MRYMKSAGLWAANFSQISRSVTKRGGDFDCFIRDFASDLIQRCNGICTPCAIILESSMYNAAWWSWRNRRLGQHCKNGKQFFAREITSGHPSFFFESFKLTMTAAVVILLIAQCVYRYRYRKAVGTGKYVFIKERQSMGYGKDVLTWTFIMNQLEQLSLKKRIKSEGEEAYNQ